MTDKEKLLYQKLLANPAFIELQTRLDLEPQKSQDYLRSIKVDNRIRGWIDEFQMPPKLPVIKRSTDFMTYRSPGYPFRSEAQINAFITETNFQL